MPIAAVLIIALQVFCGVHAVRNGNVMPWVYVIIFVPLIGCAIYIITVILPEMKNSPHALRTARNVVKIVGPDRIYRARLHRTEMVERAESNRLLAENYAGEEARCRLGLLYRKLGRVDEASGLFSSVVQNIQRGTAFYQRQQRDWLRVAQSNL